MTIEEGKVNIKIKKKRTKNPTMITTKFLAKTKNPQCTIIYKQTNKHIYKKQLEKLMTTLSKLY